MIYKDAISNDSPLVVIVSSNNILVNKTARYLKDTGCMVEVVSDNKEWKYFKDKKIRLIQEVDIRHSTKRPDYFLYFIGFGKERKVSWEYKIAKTLKFTSNFKAKTLLIFPYTRDPKETSIINILAKNVINNGSINAGLVFLSEVVSEGGELVGDEWLKNHFWRVVRQKKIILTKGKDYFSLLDEETSARTVISLLFSLRAYGRKTYIQSKPISINEFVQELRNRRYLRTNSKKTYDEIKTPDFDEKEIVEVDSKKLLKKISTNLIDVKNTPNKQDAPKDLKGMMPKTPYISNNSSDNTVNKATVKQLLEVGEHQKKKQKIQRFSHTKLKTRDEDKNRERVNEEFLKLIKQKTSRFKKAKFKLLIVFFLMFLLPYVLFYFAYGLFISSRFIFNKEKINLANNTLDLTQNIALLSSGISTYYLKTPLIGNVYKTARNSSQSLTRLSNASGEILNYIDLLSTVGGYMFDDRDYDFNNYFTQMSLSIGDVVNELGFLESELDQQPNILSDSIIQKVFKQDLVSLRREMIQVDRLTKDMKMLMGASGKRNYLVVLQNDYVLRPTGGRPDSFAIIGIEKGRIVEKEFYPAAYPERRLRGMIDKNDFYSKVLGEDSALYELINLDPDFAVSSQKMEWMIKNSLDKSVDGVVAVNLSFLENIAKILEQSKFEKVDDKNIHTAAFKNENQDELLAYLQIIFESFSGNAIDVNSAVIRKLYGALENEDIQIFIHSEDTNKSLDVLGWDGSLRRTACSNNCYGDFLAINEFVSGAFEKSQIRREAELEVEFEEGIVKRQVRYFIENQSSKNYKSIVRVIVPGNSGFQPVELVKNNGNSVIGPEISGYRGYKEAGVEVEIPAGEAVALIYNWESGVEIDLSKHGSYVINFKKQSGKMNYPFSMKLSLAIKPKIVNSEPFSLTESGNYIYNTSLLTDFSGQLAWE
jgi:hypothetical protein